MTGRSDARPMAIMVGIAMLFAGALYGRAEAERRRGRIRRDRRVYGTTAKTPRSGEEYLRHFAFMSLFAARDLQAGERIRPGDRRHRDADGLADGPSARGQGRA